MKKMPLEALERNNCVNEMKIIVCPLLIWNKNKIQIQDNSN